MYTVTFYSYKGGVGRTMALANVATFLAQQGKRVLVVDFDLEAPSLPNYGGFSGQNFTTGLVDYISEYRKTGIAPDAAKYIYEVNHNGDTMWIMPAGDTSTIDYSHKLARIDWQSLYENEKGYLFFEDLKQQWQGHASIGFDYVLVDSRTGHTDVGGICTRQLPDLLVALFLPTMQNISGIAPIIDDVRNERSRTEQPVELVFCASNVPDLDDEQQILGDLLTTAAKKLGYDDNALNLVHHYGSLHVLSHAIFAKDRPNSRLAKEYKKLTNAIASHNLNDSDGAKLALQKMIMDMRRDPRSRPRKNRDEISGKVEKIFSAHSNDGDIASLVGRVRSAIGDFDGEIAALSVAIDLDANDTSLRTRRARAYQALNMTEESVTDLRYILQHNNASDTEVTTALRMLERADRDYDGVIDKFLERRDVDPAIVNSIAEVAQRNRRHLQKFANQLQQSLANTDNVQSVSKYAYHHLALALIGSGRFDEAIQQLETEKQVSQSNLANKFNSFIATWGATGEPDLAVASELNATMSSSEVHEDANFLQCQAVIHGVSGNFALAIEGLDQADKIAERLGGRIFSCSSYLYLRPSEFLQDNEKLRQGLRTDGKVALRIFEEF